MKRILAAIDWLNDQGGKIVSFLVVFMIIVMTYEVIARHVFNSPTTWARETVKFLLGGYAILAGAYVLRQNGHVNMDLLYRRLSIRKRAILDLATSTFLFLFAGVLLWYGADYAWSSLTIGETTGSTWNPPEFPIKLAIPIGAFLLLLQGLALFIRNVMTVITGIRPE
jgi:TRAP-type mannitol/chloroaromatic compound transport system permease small subunit